MAFRKRQHGQRKSRTHSATDGNYPQHISLQAQTKVSCKRQVQALQTAAVIAAHENLYSSKLDMLTPASEPAHIPSTPPPVQ
jgi:hypothetical protein